MKRSTVKLNIKIPESANVYAETGDVTRDLLLYEVDQLEILEEVKLDTSKVHFQVRDGQYVNKGDVIFSEGLLGHKVMVADFNGIIEILTDRCRILGQKRHFERRITLDSEVVRVVPNRFIELKCHLIPMKGIFYKNDRVKLSNIIYIDDKKTIHAEILKSLTPETTVFVNDNLFIEEISKLIAFGVKRLLVNGIFLNDLQSFKKEVEKLDSIAVISGFGEFVGKAIAVHDLKKDILWGKHKLYFSSNIEIVKTRMFEHPYWGLAGEITQKNDLVGQLDYNSEVFEFYLKNLQTNE